MGALKRSFPTVYIFSGIFEIINIEHKKSDQDYEAWKRDESGNQCSSWFDIIEMISVKQSLALMRLHI